MSGNTRSVGNVAIVLNVRGDAEQKVYSVSNSLDKLSSTASKIGGSFGGIGNLFGGTLTDIQNFASMLQESAVQMKEWGQNVLMTLGEVGGGIIETAAQFEESRLGMEFTFGRMGKSAEEVAGIFQQAQDVAARTSFMTREVFDLTTQLGRSGIGDPFREVTTASGESITALEALNDLAASKGRQGMGLLLGALQNFLGDPTGMGMTSLRRRMDIPIEMVDKLKERISDTADAQEAFNVLVEETANFYGGAGRAMEGSILFQLAQIPDLFELLGSEIGKGALEPLKDIVAEVVEWLGGLLAVERETHALGNMFSEIAEAVAPVARFVFNIVKTMIDFALAHPTLVKISIAIIGIIALVALLVGGFMQLSFSIVFTTIKMAIMFVMFIAMLPLILLFGTIFIGVIVAIGLAVVFWRKIWDENMFGIRTFVEKTKAVLTGLFELISSMSEGGMGRMSRGTYNTLKRMGLLQFVADLFGAFFRLKHAVMGLWEGIKIAVTSAWEGIRPIFVRWGWIQDEMSGEMGSGFLDALNRMTPEQWERIGESMGRFIGRAMDFGVKIVEMIDQVHTIFMAVKAVFERLNEMIENVKLGIHIVQGAATGDMSNAYRHMARRNGMPAPPNPAGMGGPVRSLTAAEVARLAQDPEMNASVNRVLEAAQRSGNANNMQQAIEFAKQMASRPISVQIDGQEVAKAQAGAQAAEVGRLGIGES